jgi:hypothetical protein
MSMLPFLFLKEKTKPTMKAKLPCGYCKQYNTHSVNCASTFMTHEDEPEHQTK